MVLRILITCLVLTFKGLDGSQLVPKEKPESINTVVTEEAEAPGFYAWSWKCKEGLCRKVPYGEDVNGTVLGLEACMMICNNYGTLWPLPTGQVTLGNSLIQINYNSMDIQIAKRGKSDSLMEEATERFKQMIPRVIPQGITPKSGGKSLVVFLISRNTDLTSLTLKTAESYGLSTSYAADGRLNATIIAPNFYGVRHGLETLAQLIIYDDIHNELQMVEHIHVTDKPAYQYRGILLDTARNYYPIDSIKHMIDAMATVKLNRFHWHITDSQSFPFQSESRPNITIFGALSPLKVYTKAAIKDVVKYANARGVRVLPEFDAPAHVGEGWQGTNLTVCFNAEPWSTICAEPPCGQFNPGKPELYDALEDIYRDMIDAFEPDMFHMGGDEVSTVCWNSSVDVQEFMLRNGWGVSSFSFLKLWEHFQSSARERLYKANKGQKLPIILWTSSFTDFNNVDHHINNKDYIVQVWTATYDPQIQGLLKKGYKLIMSNYDALYLDCGYGSWVGAGNNWCSPYIGWQKIYDIRPSKDFAEVYRHQILGGEAALWSEQSDASSLDNKLWPRAAALAERLWSEPDTSWEEARNRMMHIRERLVMLGCQPDSIHPEWCYQNEGYCSHTIANTLLSDGESYSKSICMFALIFIAFLSTFD